MWTTEDAKADFKISWLWIDKSLKYLKNIQNYSTSVWRVVNCKKTTKIISFVGQIWLFYFLEDDNFCILYGSPCTWAVKQLSFVHSVIFSNHFGKWMDKLSSFDQQLCRIWNNSYFSRFKGKIVVLSKIKWNCLSLYLSIDKKFKI